MQREINLTITEKENEKRLDQALATMLINLSRSRIQQWIKQGDIKVNNESCTPKQKVFIGDIITGIVEENEEMEDLPENIPLNIIFQDDSVIVINKPAGLVVHPGAGNKKGTLLNALLYHFPELKNIPRAGIVHRLDKDTSGVMVVAKTLEAQFNLVKQLQERTVKRHYVALVTGELISGGTVEANIGRSGNDRLRMAVTPGGKEAITHYSILERYQGVTLVECKLETGRTHQIRVHLAHIRHPLVGDTLYNGRFRTPKGLEADVRDHILAFPRQALHAKKLNLLAPLPQLHDEEPEEFDWISEWQDELVE